MTQKAIATGAAVLALIFSGAVAAGDKAEGHALLKAQLTQFNGGCPPSDACANAQFSVHRAPVCPNGPDASIDSTYSASMVRQIGTSALRGGSSTLVRAGDGLSFQLTTTGLLPDAPYTAWWVAFNPDNPCISGDLDCNCSGASLRDAEDGVMYAGGAMSDMLGNAQFEGHINYGELPGGVDQVSSRFNAPIEANAEIHLVLRGHGPALRGNGGSGDDEEDD